MRLLFISFFTLQTTFSFTVPVVHNERFMILKAESGEDPSLRPHPPDNPPPSDLIDLPDSSPYFASASATSELSVSPTSEISSQEAIKAETETPEPMPRPSNGNTEKAEKKNISRKAQGSGPDEPKVEEENTEKMNSALSLVVERVGETLMDEIITPLFSSEFEKSVPSDTIKGAAITGASITLLGGQGVALSAAAATSAAYLAITPGKGGEAARVIGSTVWTSANKAAELYDQFEINRRMTSMIGMMVKGQEQNMKEVGNLESEITALLSDVEDTMGQSRSPKDEESATAKVEKEAARLEKARNDELEAERALQEEAARIAEEEARLAEEEVQLAEEQLTEEMDIAAQAREAVELFESANLGKIASEEINGSDWEDLNFNEPTDQDLEEVSTSAGFNEEFDEEFDLDTVARMAREAVNQFESELETEEIVVDRDWSLLTVINLKEELKKRELKATGRKADLVAALEKYDRDNANEKEILTQNLGSQTELNDESEIDSSTDDDPSLDIESMTVSQLKEQLRKRGMKVGGRKAELIERLAAA